MPIYKYKNEKFFKNWFPEMAYFLGFFCADGNMVQSKRGACFIEFYITHHDLLKKIAVCLQANHKLAIINRKTNWKTAYRLQIGSKAIFADLLNLGLTPRKSTTMGFPNVPDQYLNHFIRGYFDGDGSVIISNYKRKARGNRQFRTILTGFISGSQQFLQKLYLTLKKLAHLKGGTFYFNKGYRSFFSVRDSLKLYKFMYRDAGKLYLSRKKQKFEKYFGPVA